MERVRVQGLLLSWIVYADLYPRFITSEATILIEDTEVAPSVKVDSAKQPYKFALLPRKSVDFRGNPSVAQQGHLNGSLSH